VADFRYALVESDDMPIEAQAAMIAELQLPCAAIVHSGGKSLHAIVKVDAKDASQYRERVETLYSLRDGRPARGAR
jgi:RecA-family ATPase